MKKATVIQYFVILILLIVTVSLWQQLNRLDNKLQQAEEPDLYMTMAFMQNHVNKFIYSLDNENIELADFYLHELEQGAESLVKANLVYDGQPVGDLTAAMLVPVLENVADAVDSGNVEHVREKAILLVQACNNCHISTGFGEIRITERSEMNPFNQDFRRLNEENGEP